MSAFSEPMQLLGISGLAVVTGAGQGIGEAVARALAAMGAPVAVWDLNEKAACGVAAAIVEAGGRARAMTVDVGDEASVVSAAAAAVAEFGPPQVWVNNAGISKPAMLHKMTVEDFDSVHRVHVRGTFLGLREAARLMRSTRTPGSIINVTSSAGLAGTVGQVNYAGAKGAIIAMTKSAAKELGREGIRVNAVSPAAATEMTRTIRTDERFAEKYLAGIPLQRWAEPTEVAQAFQFLAGPMSSYVTGQVLCVDGGTHMAS